MRLAIDQREASIAMKNELGFFSVKCDRILI